MYYTIYSTIYTSSSTMGDYLKTSWCYIFLLKIKFITWYYTTKQFCACLLQDTATKELLLGQDSSQQQVIQREKICWTNFSQYT